MSAIDHPEPESADRDPRLVGAIFLGGAAGAVARVAISRRFDAADGTWPWAILLINLSGAFLLGGLVTYVRQAAPRPKYLRPLIGTGFCGAFTTFSTMQLELLQMIDRNRYGLATAYAAASVLGGLACVAAATMILRRLRLSSGGYKPET